MSINIVNKVAVITGGAKGIGYEIADKFLRNSAKFVILLDINENEGIEAVEKLNGKYGRTKSVFIKCDVTKDLKKVSEEIFEKYKTVDILVNNAGFINEAKVKQTISINVTAVIECSEIFYEHMRKDKNGKGGTILNVSSICGFRVVVYIPIYQASKFAVFGFTKCLGHVSNFNRTGVRVVGLCPGFTSTGFVKDMKPWDLETVDELKENLKTQVWQTPDVVGEAAVEVIQSAPSGTNWLIEGGNPIQEV